MTLYLCLYMCQYVRIVCLCLFGLYVCLYMYVFECVCARTHLDICRIILTYLHGLLLRVKHS